VLLARAQVYGTCTYVDAVGNRTEDGPTSQAQSALASQDRCALLIAPAREEAHHAPAFGAIPNDEYGAGVAERARRLNLDG
jgi:hypothetical protein